MTQHVHSLSDLKAVRIRCQNTKCGGVVEVPASRLSELFSNDTPTCRCCNGEITGFGSSDVYGGNAIVRLGKALGQLQPVSGIIEFVFSDPKAETQDPQSAAVAK
jgi:hypothetical protein